MSLVSQLCQVHKVYNNLPPRLFRTPPPPPTRVHIDVCTFICYTFPNEKSQGRLHMSALTIRYATNAIRGFLQQLYTAQLFAMKWNTYNEMDVTVILAFCHSHFCGVSCKVDTKNERRDNILSCKKRHSWLKKCFCVFSLLPSGTIDVMLLKTNMNWNSFKISNCL